MERIDKQAIQPWLRICQQHHTACKSPSQHAFLNYPTRLVWVGDTADDDVKLVETSEQCPAYLILSYCWGKSNDSSKTTEANYAERIKAIRTSKLPKTIRDAIQLTRAMGEKYIWIDAICIKQTDKGHTGDWATEAPKVGDYYANAKCLIMASSAAESEEGFLGERLAWRYPQRYSLIAHGMTFCKSQRICFYGWAPEQNFERDTVHWQPLIERGWCLQERLLNSRRLHWTSNGLFWECNTVHASETEALTGKLPPDNDEAMSQPRINTILQKDKEEALGLGWSALVNDYSSRKFTMESDRLFAIHGIASRLARQHNEVYCAGIFGSHLVNGLMWHCDVRKRWSTWLISDQSQEFPTWSWASASGKVSWPWHFGACQGPRCFIDLIRFPPYTLSPDFTEMSSRELLIRAPLVRFFLNDHPGQTIGRSCSFERIEVLGTAGLWEELDLGDVDRVELLVDNNSDAKLDRDSALLAAIVLQSLTNDIYGILLKKVIVHRREVYMRQGIFLVPKWDKSYYTWRTITPLENRLWKSELTLV